MAKENTSSQSQQSKAKAAPPTPDWTDGVARFEAFAEQMAAWEKQAIDQASEAFEHGVELTKTGLDYAIRLSEAWRSMAIDAVRQSAQSFRAAGR